MQVITEHYWFTHNQKVEMQLRIQVNAILLQIKCRW